MTNEPATVTVQLLRLRFLVFTFSYHPDSRSEIKRIKNSLEDAIKFHWNRRKVFERSRFRYLFDMFDGNYYIVTGSVTIISPVSSTNTFTILTSSFKVRGQFFSNAFAAFKARYLVRNSISEKKKYFDLIYVFDFRWNKFYCLSG